MIYSLTVWKAKKHGRINEIIRYTFQVKPEVKVTKCEHLEKDGLIQKHIKLTKEEQEIANLNIKEWLFKKTTTPIRIDDKLIWDVYPEFTEEDKYHVERMWMLEDL